MGIAWCLAFRGNDTFAYALREVPRGPASSLTGMPSPVSFMGFLRRLEETCGAWRRPPYTSLVGATLGVMTRETFWRHDRLRARSS
jgi:hypothetical protein